MTTHYKRDYDTAALGSFDVFLIEMALNYALNKKCLFSNLPIQFLTFKDVLRHLLKLPTLLVALHSRS